MNFLLLRLMAGLVLLGPTQAKASSTKLQSSPVDFFVYETGGQKRFVRRGESISIYWGDVITFEKRDVKRPSQRLKMRVMGAPVKGGIQQGLALIEGLTFDSARLFESLSRRKGWFQSDQLTGVLSYPEVYQIDLALQVGRETLGAIPVNLIFPQLNYIDITLNQAHRLVRNGQTLAVKESDLFKVHAIATNPFLHSDVFYQVVRDQDKLFLQLVRKKMLFATVVLDIER